MTSSTSGQAPENEIVEFQGVSATRDSLLDSILWVCEFHGIQMSRAALLAGQPKGARVTPTLAPRLLDQAGLGSGWIERPLAQLSSYLYPAILLCRDGSACVLVGKARTRGTTTYDVVLPDADGGTVGMSAEELDLLYAGHALLAKPRPSANSHDSLLSGSLKPEGHWLTSVLWRYRRYYYSAAFAALLVNVLTLASTFFTMNVYDRVVPNQAYATLWSLAIGVLLAMLFEFTSRHIRSHLVDMAGKKADLVLGSLLFRKALETRLEFKPQSAGSFANQFREFESVRDFVSSATVATLSDLPFCILFIGVIAMVGGPLAIVVAIALPVIVVVSVVIQRPLARAMNENLKEASLKQGMLIESLAGIESLKAACGEGWMQLKWETFSAMTAATSMKSRELSSTAVNFVTLVQQVQTVLIVVWGVYLIHAGQLSQGALIGTVMLAGRAVSPLGSVVGLAVRFQQAKAALKSLDQLVDLPTERRADRRYLSKPSFEGAVELKSVEFSYPAPPMQPAPKVLKKISLNIAAGERVGVLGNIGSGKSTLLRVMGALYEPKSGHVRIDGLDVSQIDPADVRSAIGVLGQESRLFQGTLRENVVIGKPSASTDELVAVCRLTGVDAIAAGHPRGYDMPLGEMGQGLSGGQKQLVALARCLLLQPRILLMDEPTSSMDLQTERHFLQRMATAIGESTIVVCTHRHSVLELVDRIVVMHEGQIVADGPKETILESLRAGAPNPGQVASRAA